MEIRFDEAKRLATLRERGLDFADALQVFEASGYEVEDDRFVYSERRYVTYGMLGGRIVVVVWTPTADGRRIILIRKANEREKKRFRVD